MAKKGRGSSKPPVNARPQRVNMGQLQMQLVQGQYESALMRLHQTQAQLQQAHTVIMAMLSMREGNTTFLAKSTLEALDAFIGIDIKEDGDGFIVTLVENPNRIEEDLDETDE